MAKAFPQGTIRQWQQGAVIKAHDPMPPFSSGWIPLKTSSQLEAVGATCDRLAGQILNYKDPIKGDKFLDHEIDEYTDVNGQKIFRSGDFKVYMGYYGAGRYGFRNEFSRKFMSNEMALDEKIYEEMVKANEDAGGDKNIDKLSSQQKKAIRQWVKDSWKVEREPFSPEDALKLKGIIDRTLTQLQEGLNFKDPEKLKAYQEFKAIADSLPMDYQRLKIKREQKNAAIEKLNIDFDDNWGIRESQKDYINNKFNEFVKKYQDRIKDDDLQDQLDEFGVTIDMPTEEFYDRIFEKIDFESTEDIGFKELIYLRFQTKFGKTVEGDWDKHHLPALRNMEMSINELPSGHFLTNDYLTLITNVNYNGGSHGGYAWYDAGDQRINFSSNALRRGTVFGVLSNPTEFKSVLNHEIGHAVSKKLGRAGSYDYRKFVVECGWTYTSQELRAGATATGDDEDIPRTGSNSHVKLITDYSKKSPEEAFAEYYSFYSQNKADIDNWLNTSDRSSLKRESKIVCDTNSSERSIYHLMESRIDNVSYPIIEDFKSIRNGLSGTVEHNKIELVSPWKTQLSKEETNNFDVDKIRARKNYSIDSMPPVVSYNNNDGKRVVIDGATRVEVSRMNKKLVPSITISKEFYYKLKENNWLDHDIADLVYTDNKYNNVPREASPKIKIEGLNYRDNLISVSQIIENVDVLRMMKKIYDSDELAKAIIDLFGLNKLKELSKKIEEIERV
jgi:hypothetical protein